MYGHDWCHACVDAKVLCVDFLQDVYVCVVSLSSSHDFFFFLEPSSSQTQTGTQFGVTVIQYIGELARYLINSKESVWDKRNRVRIAIGNGLRREVWLDFVNRFGIPEIGEFYGSTEGNVGFANHWIKRDHMNGDGVGSVGRMGALLKKMVGFRLLEHDVTTEMPVRDPRTGFCREVSVGQSGELVGLISDSIDASDFRGYTDPKATAKKILTDVLVKGDRYFRTGDLLRQDTDGWVYFVDRIGDTFRWKGENVSTNEVSEVISVFPGITEANVYGVKVPGNEDGRACMVALTTENGTTPDLEKLSYAHCKAGLSKLRTSTVRSSSSRNGKYGYVQAEKGHIRQGGC